MYINPDTDTPVSLCLWGTPIIKRGLAVFSYLAPDVICIAGNQFSIETCVQYPELLTRPACTAGTLPQSLQSSALFSD